MSNSNNQNLTFEQALLRLEEIVKNLSSSAINLEDMIKLHKEATDLHSFCQKKLEDAKLEMKIVQN